MHSSSCCDSTIYSLFTSNYWASQAVCFSRSIDMIYLLLFLSSYTSCLNDDIKSSYITHRWYADEDGASLKIQVKDEHNRAYTARITVGELAD